MSYLLSWDESGERYYETGVRRGVLFPQSLLTGQYEAGVTWNGLTQVQETPSGVEANAQYADDIKYLNIYSAEELGATVEAFTYPKEFELCDGSADIAAGLTIGQQARKSFGLCYRTKVGNDVNDDLGYKLHLMYGCKASPSERAYQTINDSPEPITFSWELTTTPIEIGTVNGVAYKPTSLLTFDSRYADADKLAALEQILYGTPGTNPVDARLPLPSEIISLFASTTYTMTWVNGTTVIGTSIVAAGEEPEFLGTAPTKEGYTFLGWSANPSATTATDPLPDAAADAIYYAIFQQN